MRFLLILFAIYTASAQLPMIAFSGGGGGTRDGGYQGTATFRLLRRTLPNLLHAPFYGEPKIETSRTLPDGTHIDRVMPDRGNKVWRDSQGRVRIEQSLSVTRRPNIPTLVEIDDPVAGEIYILDTTTKTAHRAKVTVSPPWPSHPTAPSPSDFEDLGTQTIDGLTVHGTRTKRVEPPNATHDAPLTITTETWFSSEWQLAMRTVVDDPRAGAHTSSIVNFSRVEPDPSLFLVPPDYTVVDEPGEFTLRWGGR